MNIRNNKQDWKDIINDDFETMSGMLSVIKERIQNVPPSKQRDFYEPLRRMIFEAWQDATNPEDTFLYEHEKMYHPTQTIE